MGEVFVERRYVRKKIEFAGCSSSLDWLSDRADLGPLQKHRNTLEQSEGVVEVGVMSKWACGVKTLSFAAECSRPCQKLPRACRVT